MALYRASARERLARDRQVLEERRALLLAMAREGAALLKQDFGADHVILFGSLGRDGPISPHSDVDLAVWGIEEGTYLRALARLLALRSDVSFDLVRAEEAGPTMLARIAEEGVPL